MRKGRGITLIALIITIVILIILAGVSINLVIGDNGIIGRAKGATEETRGASVEEQVVLWKADIEIIKHAGGTSETYEQIRDRLHNEKLLTDEDIQELAKPENTNLEVVIGSKRISFKTEKTGENKPSEELPEIELPSQEISTQFNKANGIIDIIWLDTENNVIDNPISPVSYLGGLTAIKYNGTDWIRADETNIENDWYNYIAQIGIEDGKTSNWANARSSNSNAYFVWIPRYAYRITYFDTEANKELYKQDNKNETAKTGIVGYSTIYGMVDTTSGVRKLVEGTEPTNVAGKVQTKGYMDYIPHPAFEFDGKKAGIWVSKYEASGSTKAVTILPNTSSLRAITVSDIFTACQGVKTTYSLTSDSHMMKNTEWGAIAYLTESKYGRNGIEVTINNSSSYYTGGGIGDAYKTNVLQSTTGNIYGIYDMNGGAWEYVAGFINNSNVRSNGYNTSLLNAVETNNKYADVYKKTNNDTQGSNYLENKGIKGDAVYETSANVNTNSSSWHGDVGAFPFDTYPVFGRGRVLQ